MKKDRLWDEIETAFTARLNKPIPTGWKTAQQYAKETGMTPSSASNKLKQMQEAGLLERQPFSSGLGAKSYIYRPKKK